MITINETTLIPIGASCIVNFQLEFLAKRLELSKELKSTLFDWNIATPLSTSKVLASILSGTFGELLADKDNFDVIDSRLRFKPFEGFYFWHQNALKIMEGDSQYFDHFVSKQMHKANNMSISNSKAIVCLWSNIQPNLMEATSRLPNTWADFKLTSERIEQIQDSVNLFFGSKAKVIFISRHEDVVDLTPNSEIEILQLPRSRDFRGESNLFSEIFERLQMENGNELRV